MKKFKETKKERVLILSNRRDLIPDKMNLLEKGIIKTMIVFKIKERKSNGYS